MIGGRENGRNVGYKVFFFFKESGHVTRWVVVKTERSSHVSPKRSWVRGATTEGYVQTMPLEARVLLALPENGLAFCLSHRVGGLMLVDLKLTEWFMQGRIGAGIVRTSVNWNPVVSLLVSCRTTHRLPRGARPQREHQDA